MTSSIVQADCLDWLAAMPPASCDLVLTSPPYEKARLYLENGEDMNIARDTEAWVAWMVQVIKASLRVCRGLVAFVVEGQTEDFRYSCGPALLMADLHRAGVHLRKPPIFHRIGIPGSGGPDWVRNDYEFVICATNGGKLLWSDNTAMGHPPKWAPGGEMSHRLSDGKRVNQWGPPGGPRGMGKRKKDNSTDTNERPSHKLLTKGGELIEGCENELSDGDRDKWGMSAAGTGMRRANGERRTHGRRVVRGTANGDTSTEDAYDPPAIANPGNTVQEYYRADEVAALLDEAGNLIHCKVGGGLLGSHLAHDNEAPFPERLADFFVLSFCPPGGLVRDCFCGSGTTGASAVTHGRNFEGCDLRASQVELAQRRLRDITPLALFEG